MNITLQSIADGFGVACFFLAFIICVMRLQQVSIPKTAKIPPVSTTIWLGIFVLGACAGLWLGINVFIQQGIAQ